MLRRKRNRTGVKFNYCMWDNIVSFLPNLKIGLQKVVRGVVFPSHYEAIHSVQSIALGWLDNLDALFVSKQRAFRLDESVRLYSKGCSRAKELEYSP